MRPDVLLVVGIHREERAFGESVAAGVDRDRIDVLVIPDGLSGEHPRPERRFQYDTLHKALYLQLLPHVIDRYALLIDLHTGKDTLGPSADVICADESLRDALRAMVDEDAFAASYDVRFVPLGEGAASPHARTVIPTQVWRNSAFRYLGIEMYLPNDPQGAAPARALALRLIGAAAQCVETQSMP